MTITTKAEIIKADFLQKTVHLRPNLQKVFQIVQKEAIKKMQKKQKRI
jgi:hypothetical protein